MRTADELALVVELACLTGDRTKAEQRALLAVAKRVDRERNRQTTSNPALGGRSPGLDAAPPCTYPDPEHGKACVCRGDKVAQEPDGGWSLLAWLVEDTWEGS